VNVVTRWVATPAAGTTAFSGNDIYGIPLIYTPGFEMFYLNGVLLLRGVDYFATDGLSITLGEPTITNDVVEVICPLQITTADTYTQAQINALNQSDQFILANQIFG
jgi:hypothetical protein